MHYFGYIPIIKQKNQMYFLINKIGNLACWWQHLSSAQTVWSHIRTERTQVLILIQTVHFDHNEIFFQKNTNFEKESVLQVRMLQVNRMEIGEEHCKRKYSA